MTAFAYFGNYPNRVDLYISARASDYTDGWEFAEMKLMGDHLVVIPKTRKEHGCVKIRKVDPKRNCDAITMSAAKFFSSGLINKSIVGKRLKLKKMKTDEGYALVVCLKEEVV